MLGRTDNPLRLIWLLVGSVVATLISVALAQAARGTAASTLLGLLFICGLLLAARGAVVYRNLSIGSGARVEPLDSQMRSAAARINASMDELQRVQREAARVADDTIALVANLQREKDALQRELADLRSDPLGASSRRMRESTKRFFWYGAAVTFGIALLFFVLQELIR